MLKLLADEDFHGHIVRGVLRRLPGVDLVRVQDVGLDGQVDPVVLEWAAQEGRILLTHDVSTMPAFIEERVRTGRPMPGVFFVPRPFALVDIIQDLVLLIQCSEPDEYAGIWVYLPLR